MRHFPGYLVLIVLFAGCATEAEIAAGDRTRCIGLGFSETGDGYKNCRLSLSLDRDMRRRLAAESLDAMVQQEAMRQELEWQRMMDEPIVIY